MARAASVEPANLPAVISPTATRRHATSGALAEHLGLAYRRVDGHVHDLIVVGAGLAALAAAVYGASEGLDTLLLDAVAAGGQTAASSRIENYLGFTSGISGAELTRRAAVQAQKFGARIASPCQVAALATGTMSLQVVLVDGNVIKGRAVVVATGAAYRCLPLPRWQELIFKPLLLGDSVQRRLVVLTSCLGKQLIEGSEGAEAGGMEKLRKPAHADVGRASGSGLASMFFDQV